MTDWAQIATIAVSALTPLGAAIGFVWVKVEKRFGAIDTALAECRDRERESLTRRSVQLTVIELLWQEVRRYAPDSDVLRRAKHLLDELKNRADLDALTAASAKLALMMDKEQAG
jgi:hypothetical protein